MFEFDPFDAAYYSNPFPYYAQMRAEHPVYRREIENHRIWPHYWMLSRADDINAALADWRTFSSALGTLVDTDTSLIPPNIFNMDPPRHDELRSVLARVLTPSRIAGLEPHIRQYTHGLIAEFQNNGGFDAATEFAHMIPTVTMCSLMDLPLAERQRFLDWNLVTMAGADFTSPEALTAYGEMGGYWTGLVAERRQKPGSDLISQIIHADVDGTALSNEEIGGFCSLLHDAAQNTTMNMITHGVMTLARHPEQRHQLTAHPDLWNRGVEELLRFVSPVQGLTRSTTRDVELHGETIPKGDQVLLLYGSANHDENAYPNAEQLDLDRPNLKAHWAFGHGIHYCLGNAVARLEIKVSLQMLCEQAGDWTVDEDSVDYNQLVPTRGVAHASITF